MSTRRNLSSLRSYSGAEPIQHNIPSAYPPQQPCHLIVDPETNREVQAIIAGASPSAIYFNTPPRDINEIVDVINQAINNGMTPYYWSRTRHVYLPITQALTIRKFYPPGVSAKEVVFYLVVEILGTEREVDVGTICSIDDVNF